MTFKSRRHKHSILRSIMFSYLTICTMIMLINIAFTQINNNTISEQNLKINSYILDEATNQLDKSITDLSSLTLDLLYSDEFLIYVPRETNLKGTEYYNANKVSVFISSITSSVASKAKLGIYLEDLDKIIVSDGTYDAKYFYQYALSDDKEQYDNWIEKICSNNNEYFQCEFHNLNEETEYLFYSAKRKIDNNIIVFAYTNTNEIYNRIQKIHNKTGHSVYISNQSGNVSFESKTDTLQPSAVIADKTKVSKQDYIAKKGSDKWNYYLVFDTNKMNSPIFQSYLLIFINLGIELAFAILMSFYYSKRYYTPIEKIKDKLTQNSVTDDEYLNDYQLIEQHINSIIQEKSKITESMQTLTEENSFRNLLFGKSDEETAQIIKEYFIGCKCWCVALMKPKEESITAIKKSGYSDDNIHTILSNISEEILARQYINRVFSIHQYYCALIGGKEVEESVIKKAFEYIHSAIKKYYNIEIITAISMVQDDVATLNELYQNAEEVLNLSKMIDAAPIVLCRDFETKMDYKYNNYEIQTKLMNFIKSSNPEKAFRLLEELIDNSLNNAGTSVILEQTVFKIMSILSYAINSIAEETDKTLRDKYDPFDYLMPFHNISDLKSNLKDYLYTICLLISNKNSDDQSLINDIKKYIDDNFANYNLSASIISKQFEIQPTTMSTMFKKKFGIGMSDYITMLRVDKVKQILLNTDEKLEIICETVGYSNSRSLLRAFKRVEGITPGQYRKEYKKE